MPTNRRHLLILAGAIVSGISALHVACAIIGPAAYRYFGAGEHMATQAEAGSPLPFLVTILLALVFGVFAAYALSAAGRIRRLPLVRPVVGTIGAIFALRGLLLFVELVSLVREPASVPSQDPVFSAVSLLVGGLYLIGGFGRGNKQLR
jgi:hypothetical protein